LEHPANLERWGALFRAVVIDFELFSRLGFSSQMDSTDKPTGPMTVWHLNVTQSDPTKDYDDSATTVAYQPLARFIRPGIATFVAQMELLNNYADLRPDRASEIISQLGGGQAFLASITYLNVERTKYTLELLAAVQRVATFVEMRIKFALACRRGIEFSPQIEPMIAVPTHAALPSGHATETFAMSTVLWYLLSSSSSKAVYSQSIWGSRLMRVAARVAINRQVAGVHTPVESVAGAMLGLTLGNYLVARFGATATYDAWQFDGTIYPHTQDFDWTLLFNVDTKLQLPTATSPFYITSIAKNELIGAPSPVLKWLWCEALKEWT
jgi:membrane-associated phospholipid phosphatase